jgi:WD40 repeat protein
MDEASDRYAWRTISLMLVVAVCMLGCSGGAPGTGAGSTSQMRRQIEAATEARRKARLASRPADQGTASQTAVAEQSIAAGKLPPDAPPATASEPTAGAKAKEEQLAATPATTPSSDKPETSHPDLPARRSAVSSDASLLAIDGPDGSVRLFDAKSGSVLAAWPAQNTKRSALAIDSVHQVIAAASSEGPISLLPYASKRQEGLDDFARLHEGDFGLTLRGHHGRVSGLSFDRDGQQLISAGEDATVRVWRMSTAAPAAVAVGRPACVPAVDSDGKMIAVATADHAVEMQELNDARRSRRLQRHKAPITALAFGHAKDLWVLVSADEKGLIHVWDLHADSDQEAIGHARGVTGLAFDETRRRIVSVSSDGSLRIAPYPASQSQVLANLTGPPASLALTANQQYVAVNVGPASLAMIPLAGDADPQTSHLHGEGFTSFAIAPDGEVVLLGTAAGSVVCQNRRDGATMAQFTAAGGTVRGLAVHPDGKRFAYCGDDGVIRVARLPDEERRNSEEVAIEAHVGPVRSLAFTPDGQMLVSAGADGMVRLWNLAQRSELVSFSTAGIEPTVVCGARDGATIVVACGKKTVLTWHRDAHKPASKLPIRGEVRSLALAPTGVLAVSMADGDIQLWDLNRQLEVERLTGHVGPVDHLAFAGDTRLVSAGADKTVRLWSLSRTRVIQAHRGAVRGLAVSEDNGRIVTGGDDRRLCVWSHEGDLVRDHDLRLRISGLALNPRRPQVAIFTDDSFKKSEVIRWNLDEAAPMEPLPTPSAITALSYSSDGKKLAVAGTDNTLRVYHAQGGTLLEEIQSVTSWASVRFGKDDEHLITSETDNVVRTYPLRVRHCFQLAAPATCATVSPDGDFLLTGAQDGDVRLWSLHSNDLRYEMQKHAHPIAAAAFSGDGKKAFSADRGGAVRVWSLESELSPNQPLTTYETLEHPGAVRSLEVSTSGATMVSGSDDGVARVWDVAEGKVKESYTGQALPVVTVRLVDIERSVLACNAAGVLNLWKRPTEAEIAKGASRDLAQAAKSIDLTAISTEPPSGGHAEAPPSSKVAALEHLLRTARLPAERDVWREKIQAAGVAPSQPGDHPLVSPKLVPRGHVPPTEIGKGDPWDMSPAAELQTSFPFDGTTNFQIEMAISSDGKLLAAVPKADGPGGARRVCVWDLPTGVELRRWESTRAGRWQTLSFAGSNDAFLYTSPDVTAFDLSRGEARRFADDCLAVPISSGDQILFGRSSGPVAAARLLMRIDGGRFHEEWTGLMGHETLVTALACSPNGRWAAVGVRERLRHKLILFDLSEMTVASVLDEAPHAKAWSSEGPIGISDAVFSSDGKRLFWHGEYGPDDFRSTTALASPSGFNVVEKSIAKSKQPIVTNHVIGYVAGAADTLYFGTKTGLVLREGKSGKVTNEINLAERHGIPIPGSEARKGEKQRGKGEGDEVRASRVQYVVSPDGAWMASADDSGKVVLWDLTTPRRPCNTFGAHTGPVVGLRFSLDGRWLATAGEENCIRLWSLTELQQRRQRQMGRKAAALP